MKKPPNKWYTAYELRAWLDTRSYPASEIPDKLCEEYGMNLQSAFRKGWEMGRASIKNGEASSGKRDGDG